jgi:hypothetical protein
VLNYLSTGSNLSFTIPAAGRFIQFNFISERLAFYVGINLDPSHWRKNIKSVAEQITEKNIWTWERGRNGRMQESA